MHLVGIVLACFLIPAYQQKAGAKSARPEIKSCKEDRVQQDALVSLDSTLAHDAFASLQALSLLLLLRRPTVSRVLGRAHARVRRVEVLAKDMDFAIADGSGYRLLDSGNAERLEEFGGIRVRRSCPSADWLPGLETLEWAAAELVQSQGSHGGVEWGGPHMKGSHDSWSLRTGAGFSLGLWPGQHGQVGAFPEQQENWQWLRSKCEAASRPLRVLNLFAYTGGSTLACAASGNANITHVDGMKQAVKQARDNAERSGLVEMTVRWLVEDVVTYVEREIGRGRRYDGIILDPPTFGRGGPKKKEWKIDRDLSKLSKSLSQLLSDDPAFVLLSAHSQSWPLRSLEEEIQVIAQSVKPATDRESGDLVLRAQCDAGKDLPMGRYVRWSWEV